MIPREQIKEFLKFFGVLGIIASVGLYVLSIFIYPILSGTIVGYSILLGIIGVILFIAGKKIRGTISYFVCGSCNFVAETERELYNHTLTCEKKKQEDSKNS